VLAEIEPVAGKASVPIWRWKRALNDLETMCELLAEGGAQTMRPPNSNSRRS